MTYSQYNEEALILQEIDRRGITAGRFLDLGAYHPKTFSNTRALYERGWSGVMVEASPHAFCTLVEEYRDEPSIQLVCCAVGTGGGVVRLRECADAVSSTVESATDKWRDAGTKYWPITVLSIDVIDLLAEDNFGPRYDFISIDIEGLSVPVFARLLTMYDGIPDRPSVMCVEYDDQLDECINLSARYGYEVIPPSEGRNPNGTNLVVRKTQ